MKSNKIIAGIVAALVIFGLVFSIYGVNRDRMVYEKAAIEFFEGVAAVDLEKVYKHLEVGDSVYTGLDSFKATFGSEDHAQIKSEISGCKVSKAEQNGGAALVTLEFMNAGEKEPSNAYVVMYRDESTKYHLIPEWKVDNTLFVVNNFQLAVPAGAGVAIDGIDMPKDYYVIEKEGKDIYLIPAIFPGYHDVTLKEKGAERTENVFMAGNSYIMD